MTPQTSPPGSSVHWIIQATTLEWVAISFSRGSSWLKNQTGASPTAGRFFMNWVMREALLKARGICTVVCGKAAVSLQSQDRTRNRKARSGAPRLLRSYNRLSHWPSNFLLFNEMFNYLSKRVIVEISVTCSQIFSPLILIQWAVPFIEEMIYLITHSTNIY